MSTNPNTTPQNDAMTEEEKLQAEEERQEESAKLQKKVVRSEKSVKRYQFFILRLIIIIVVLWILFFKIIGLTHMPSSDMFPRIDAGDLVMFYRLDKDVRSQDVVVFEKQTPDSSGKEMFISRVVAVTGDTVEITEGGMLFVNGNAVSEPKIFYSTQPYEGFTTYPVTLGPDECFVLADRREGGSDSRYFGTVKKDELLGTVITIMRRHNL